MQSPIPYIPGTNEGIAGVVIATEAPGPDIFYTVFVIFCF
jgi:hypothetical protein